MENITIISTLAIVLVSAVISSFLILDKKKADKREVDQMRESNEQWHEKLWDAIEQQSKDIKEIIKKL